MNKLEFEAKAKEILTEEYVQELVKLDTPEEVRESLKAKGLEVTKEDIIQLKEMLQKMDSGELTDEDLEKVSAGCWVAVTLGVLIGTSFASGIGTLVAACVMSIRERRW